MNDGHAVTVPVDVLGSLLGKKESCMSAGTQYRNHIKWRVEKKTASHKN